VQVSLLFFPGSGLPGEIVRFGTRGAYAHVAIRLDDTVGDNVYEAVAPRVLRRAYDAAGSDHTATEVGPPAACDLTQIPAMQTFLESVVGDPYDWDAIGADAVADLLNDLRILPSGISIDDHRGRSWDCSRLAAAALAVLGWHPAAIDNLGGPVSPSDLYRLITEAGVIK
jgi:hypothetical protein